MTDREQALNILMRIDRESLFAAPLFDQVSGDDRDRRFVRTLVLGVLRWRSRLDFLIERLSGRRVATLDEATRQLLRLGFYQLFASDVPPHAAVYETVALAAKRSARSKGLINAVLRKASAQRLDEILPDQEPLRSATQFAHPEWLFRRWVERFGLEKARAIAAANQELSYPDLLVNRRMLTRDQGLEMLRAREIEGEPSPLHRDFIRLRTSTSLLQDELERGLFYAMDEGSAIIASLVDRSAKRVLDFTAAPGGKSLALALGGHEVVSHDISFSRLELLTRSAPAVLGKRGRLVVGDGREPAFRGSFDAVLLDAPCSATGTIRRNPELKWRVSETSIREAAELQLLLLRAALELTGRECVYATCSLEREENEGVVERVLSGRSDFRVEPWPAEISALGEITAGGQVLILSPDRGTDGFIAQKLVRNTN